MRINVTSLEIDGIPNFEPQVKHKNKWIENDVTHRDVSIEQGEVVK